MKSTRLPDEDTGQGPGPGALILLILNLPLFHHQRIMVKYLLHRRVDPDQAHHLGKGVWFPIEISSELDPGCLLGRGSGKPSLGSDKTSMKTVYALAPCLTLHLNLLGITRKAYECGIKLVF